MTDLRNIIRKLYSEPETKFNAVFKETSHVCIEEISSGLKVEHWNLKNVECNSTTFYQLDRSNDVIGRVLWLSAPWIVCTTVSVHSPLCRLSVRVSQFFSDIEKIAENMARNNDYERRVRDREDPKPDKSSQPLAIYNANPIKHEYRYPYHGVFYDYTREFSSKQ